MDVAWFAHTNFSRRQFVGDSLNNRQRAACSPIQGKIANARAGKPDPSFGFGKLITAIAPASGT